MLTRNGFQKSCGSPKIVTTKQRKLEVNAIAWLEKHLDEPVPA